MKQTIPLLMCFLAMMANNARAADLESEILPVNVYAVSEHIRIDLLSLRRHLNIDTPINDVLVDARKTPSDVYESAYELMEQLANFARSHKTDLSNLDFPERKSGRKIPFDVFQVLSAADACLHAVLTYRYPGAAQNNLLSSATIKLPTDVYVEVRKSIFLLETVQ